MLSLSLILILKCVCRFTCRFMVLTWPMIPMLPNSWLHSMTAIVGAPRQRGSLYKLPMKEASSQAPESSCQVLPIHSHTPVTTPARFWNVFFTCSHSPWIAGMSETSFVEAGSSSCATRVKTYSNASIIWKAPVLAFPFVGI